MVLLQSTLQELSTTCPYFSLTAVADGKIYTLKDFAESKALLIAFICNHCPYVKAIEDRLIALNRAFTPKDFSMVAICSNDSKRYPDDSPDSLKERWLKKGYGFPYLVDLDQTVAKAFGAVCTPDLFLFDEHRQLFYHGQLDDSWQDPSKVTRQDLMEAIVAIIDGKAAPKPQKPSMGCSIKWLA